MSKWLHHTVRAIWQALRPGGQMERLEREYLEAQNLGQEFLTSKHDVQDINPKYQHDLLRADESSNVFID